MVNRAIALPALLALLVAPLALVQPQPTAAEESTMTIVTVERGSGKPVRNACYTVADISGVPFGVGGACDRDDGNSDGTTIVRSTDPCDLCRVHQGLGDNGDNPPVDYVPAPDQEGGFGQTYTFKNFLKPPLVVTAVDAKTGDPVKGACVVVSDVSGVPFAVAGGCDGGPTDQDDRRNGKFETPRLNPSKYRVDQKSPPPSGYSLGAKSVTFRADPVVRGKFEAVTIKLRRQN